MGTCKVSFRERGEGVGRGEMGDCVRGRVKGLEGWWGGRRGELSVGVGDCAKGPAGRFTGWWGRG